MGQVRHRVHALLSAVATPVHRFWRYRPDAHALLHGSHAMSFVALGATPMYWPAPHRVPLHAVHAVAAIAPYPPLNVEGGQGVDAIPPRQ